jgi:hypothetical protein
MNKPTKIFLWTIGTLMAVVIFLFVLMVLSARVINRESIKNRIQTEISQTLNVKVEFQNLDISFFPKPKLIIHQGNFSVPGTAHGTLSSLTISIKFLPLFIGKFQNAGIDINSPDVKIDLAGPDGKKEDDLKAVWFKNLEEKIGYSLKTLSEKTPGFSISVKNGRLNFIEDKMAGFKFQDINARIAHTTHKISFDIQCKSTLWEGISIKGAVNPENFKSRGSIKLTRIHSKFLSRRLFSLLNHKVQVSPVNLNIDFKADGIKSIQGNLSFSALDLTIHPGEKESGLKIKRFKGGVDLNENNLIFTLDELKLDYPELDVSGRLDFTPSSSSTPGKIVLEISGTNVDVASTREVALELIGENSVVQIIFKIIKAGKVPAINYTDHADSFANLGSLKNITLRGGIVDGKIFVPGAALDLEKVEGNVTIAKGVLYGQDLKAQLETSRCLAGSLKLGLKDKDALFNLDITLDADLALLPPILKRVVKNDAFLKELALIDNPKGRATGKLYLGDSLDSIEARVEVSQFDLSANYRRLPHPLKINSGQYFFKGITTGVNNLSGSMGKSSFSALSSQTSWDKAPELKITSGTAFIDLNEIYPWLKSSKIITMKLYDLQEVHGVIALSSMQYQGKLFESDIYQFQIAGEARNIALNSSLLPGPLEVTKGFFSSTAEDISISDFHTRILDASLKVSGDLKDYLKDLSQVDLTFQGDMGPDSVGWISDILKLPDHLHLRPPISVSTAHMAWNHRQETVFSGDLVFQPGIKVSTKIHADPHILTIKKLTIQDQDHNASIKFTQENRTADFFFAGILHKSTLDGIVAENQFLNGWINGNFHARVLLDQPLNSTLQGKVQVKNLFFPWTSTSPLIVNDLSLVGIKDTLQVETAKLSWADNQFEFRGNVDLSAHVPNLNMELYSEAIDLDQLIQAMDKYRKKNPNPTDEKAWTNPIRGVLKLKTDYLAFKGFTWNPFQADIIFNDRSADIAVTNAILCTISTPGTLKISPGEIDVHVKPSVRGQKVKSLISCLLDQAARVEGDFNLDGELTAHGQNEQLIQSIGGHIEFDAAAGRIYAGRFYSVLIDISNLIQVTEMFKGKMPDLSAEGFGYHSIHIKADVQKSILNLNEMVIDGMSMGIVCHGYVDYFNKKMDITALVAPLKTIDFIVRYLPGVNYILGGSLISIPVRIKGDLNNPRVTPISPTAVGSGLLGIMKRTLRLPVKIIEPVLLNQEPVPPDKEKSQ